MLVSFWDGLFSGAMLVSGTVAILELSKFELAVMEAMDFRKLVVSDIDEQRYGDFLQGGPTTSYK